MELSPLIITLKVAVLATLITVILGIPVAWKVAGLKKGKGIIDGLLTLPMILPPTVVGFFLLLLLGKNGLIGSILLRLHITITFTWVGAVIAAVVVAFPLMYRTARGAFESLDPNLIYAGQTLGMTDYEIFFRIILPNTVSSMTAGIILTFARALGEFGATIMLAGNIPGKTQTMAIAVYSAVQSGNRIQAYTWAMIIMVLSFGAMIGMNWINNRNRKANVI